MREPILVTGARGFAGGHLVDVLIAEGATVVGWRRPGSPPPLPRPRLTWTAVDLLDRERVARAVAELAPATIVHCAGAPHVASSWQDTLTPLQSNALGTHHLLSAVRHATIACRVVVPSSALVYRASSEALDESAPLGPSSPYGVSKLVQEMLALRAASLDGLDVVVARPFNHAGPRQDPSFVTASFARQIALAEAGRAEPVIRVGNLDARRDVTDVRDTVAAYRRLVDRGAAGCVYNVCRGRAYSARELLDGLLAHARVRLDVRVDPSRLRPNDDPVLVGSPSRIEREVGWRARIPIARTLGDLLEYWRERAAVEARA